MFVALARTAERRLGDLGAQDLANTAWAFATSSQCDVQLFSKFALVAERHLCDFSTLELAKAISDDELDHVWSESKFSWAQ